MSANWVKGNHCVSPLCTSADQCRSYGCTFVENEDDARRRRIVEGTFAPVVVAYYDSDADVVAAFDEIEAHRAEAEAIVRALAAIDEPLDSEYDVCKLCEFQPGSYTVHLDLAVFERATRHDHECAWRRAKEWVDGE